MKLALVALSADPTINGVAPVYPSAGEHVDMHLQITNAGQQGGSYSLAAQLVLSGTNTVEAHFGTVTGTVPGTLTTTAPSTTAMSTDKGMTYWQNIGGYNTKTGLDIQMQLTDTTTNESVSYVIPSAVFLPSESPSSLSITSVTLGVSS